MKNIAQVEGIVTLANGQAAQFMMTLDYGRTTWGAPNETLAAANDALDSMYDVLIDYFADDEEN